MVREHYCPRSLQCPDSEVCLYAGQILGTVLKPAGDKVAPKRSPLFFTTARKGRREKNRLWSLRATFLCCDWWCANEYIWPTSGSAHAKPPEPVGPKASGDTGTLAAWTISAQTLFRVKVAQTSVLVPDSLVTPVFAAGYRCKWGYGRGTVVNEYRHPIMIPARPSDCVKDCVPVGCAPSVGELAPDLAVPGESVLRVW